MTITRIAGVGKQRAAIIVAVGSFLAALALVLIAGPARAVDDPPCEIDCGVDPPVNAPPSVSANLDFVPVPEGLPTATDGTYSDPDGNGTVTLRASVGTITKDASGDGTLIWSF